MVIVLLRSTKFASKVKCTCTESSFWSKSDVWNYINDKLNSLFRQHFRMKVSSSCVSAAESNMPRPSEVHFSRNSLIYTAEIEACSLQIERCFNLTLNQLSVAETGWELEEIISYTYCKTETVGSGAPQAVPIFCRSSQLVQRGARGESSTGGVEDPAHLGALPSQFVVFSDGLLRLQDSDVDPFLLHEVQSGGGNLREETAQNGLMACLHRSCVFLFHLTRV